MIRALVLICSSAALGLWLADRLFKGSLREVDALRLRRGAELGVLAAACLQLGLLHGHGSMLLDRRSLATWVDAMAASTRTHVGAVLWSQWLLLVLAGLSGRVRAGGVAAAALLASVVCAALSGHVAASGDSTVLSVIAVSHVGGVGIWFGGLPALWLLWRHPRPSVGTAEPLDARALRAFSRFALPAMLVILASGVLLATRTVGRWAALVATPYGWLLLAKLGLVALVLACAWRLRQSLRGRRAPVTAANGRWLAREGVLACGVIAAASTLATWVPAAHESFDWPFGFRFAPQAAWLQRQEQIRWPLAAAAVLVVFALGLGAATWRRRRRFASVAAGSCMACGLALAVPALTVDAYPSSYRASAAPYDAASVVAGARLYQSLCARCHGARGQGDGPLAGGLKPVPADLTAPHLGLHLHGDMYWWITHGYFGSAMPAFEGRTTELERWQLVDYLTALSLGHQARTLGERPVASSPWLPAINFRYPKGADDYLQLSELQLDAPVLLVLIGAAAECSRLGELGAPAGPLPTARLKVVAVLAPGLRCAGALPAGVDEVSDTGGEISAAWSHYRRTLAQPDFRDELPEPARMELLVDRYGYVRARWRADEGARKPTTDALVSALETLAREPEFPLADVHAH